MTCECHEEQRHRGEDVPEYCPRSGRRLARAWPWIQGQIETLKLSIKDTVGAGTEHSQSTQTIIQGMIRLAMSALKYRFQYLGLVPWCIAQADTVEGAAEFLRQVALRPLEDHDLATRDIMSRLEGDLRVRAEGGELSAALAAEVKAANTTNLDESVGEGTHRGTTLEQKRAPSSKTAALKRSIRLKGIIAKIRWFRRKYGGYGKKVVRYEFRNYKRILQTTKKKFWQNARPSRAKVIKRVYREDDRADVDWNIILQRVEEPRPVEHETIRA